MEKLINRNKNKKIRNIKEERKYMKIDIYITSNVEKDKLKQLQSKCKNMKITLGFKVRQSLKRRKRRTKERNKGLLVKCLSKPET